MHKRLIEVMQAIVSVLLSDHNIVSQGSHCLALGFFPSIRWQPQTVVLENKTYHGTKEERKRKTCTMIKKNVGLSCSIFGTIMT
jgi:hypothetical protein